MLSSVGLEVMNSTNPDLNWKTVKKGRRSRKSTGRILNGVAKVGNSTSPKRVGDFSGSDSDKFGEAVLGQSTSGKSENVPIKKRRNLLQSSSSHPWTPSLRRHNSSSSPLPEDPEQLPYSSSSGKRSSSSYSNWQLRGNDGSAEVKFGKRKVFLCDRTEGEYNCAEDFSGIELLAAAASMDDDADNANKEDLVAEDLLLPKNADASSFATQSKLCLESNESENALSNITVHGANTDCSLVLNNSAAVAIQQLGGSPDDGIMPKVNRQHWDLNIPMDDWDEPYDDSMAGNTSVDVTDNDMHMEERQKGSKEDVLVPGCARDESSNLKMEEDNLTANLLDRTCPESPSLEKSLLEPPNSFYSNAAKETSDRVTEMDADDRNSNQVLRCNAHMEILSQVMNKDAINTSPLTKLLRSSSMLMSEENLNTKSATAAIMQDEDCSSNVSESERIAASDQIQTGTHDVTVDDVTAIVISESAIDVQHKDIKDSQRTSEPPGHTIALKETINSVTCEGLDVDNSRSNSDDVNYSPSKCVNFLASGTCIEDGQSVLIADSKIRDDGTFVTGSTIADFKGQLQPVEDNNLPNEGSKRIITEDSCKSYSAGALCDDPTNSVEKTGSTTNDRHDSDVSRHNHVHMIDGDELTRFQEEGYDSPFEDGELRGSFMYSWEENEMENECVDYESDGRNGDGSDAADYPGSEIVEDVSEGSNGTVRRSSLIKRFPQSNGSRPSSRSHFIKDDSNDNEIAGKGESNAGSGTTVEQSMEMIVEENETKRRNLTNGRDSIDGKVAVMDEYGSKMARGKLQSRIEGQSSMDASDGNHVFFMQQCRSRRPGGSYSRPERDVSPDKYVGRYRPATNNKRDGVDQWTYWGSRRCYNASSYAGPEGHPHTRPRNITENSPDKYGGTDFHKPRQNPNYFSKGFHKPFIRRSPVDRDDCFGTRRRMPLTRGVSSYRSRGHYSQRPGRDFGEDHLDSRPDDFLPKRERHFSPNSARGTHMPLPRRRSRSRSRTRSPKVWVPHRERNLGGSRRFSRSPDFRPEARMERIRAPFSKPTFASDFGEGYNPRWGDDRNFGENHLRRRRSPPPVREFRRTQNSDENFRPNFRPGRFSFMRESKFEPNYDDRRRDDNDEMMHRRHHSGDGGSFRRLRRNNDFQTSSLSNLNNEDDNIRGADPREVPQTQIDTEEDKRAFKI